MADARKILREVYEAAHELFGDRLGDVWLYGSYARGDWREDSDVDILVSAHNVQPSDYRLPIAHIASEIGMENDVMISIILRPDAHVRRYAQSHPYYQNVLREGIRYERS